ncbi:MAG: DUF4190 domain-containing protein [Planctomycetota bacterium]
MPKPPPDNLDRTEDPDSVDEPEKPVDDKTENPDSLDEPGKPVDDKTENPDSLDEPENPLDDKTQQPDWIEESEVDLSKTPSPDGSRTGHMTGMGTIVGGATQAGSGTQTGGLTGMGTLSGEATAGASRTDQTKTQTLPGGAAPPLFGGGSTSGLSATDAPTRTALPGEVRRPLGRLSKKNAPSLPPPPPPGLEPEASVLDRRGEVEAAALGDLRVTILKTSKLAILSLVCGCLAVMGPILIQGWGRPGLMACGAPAVFFGVLAADAVRRNPHALSGRMLAYVGMSLGILLSLMTFVIALVRWEYRLF